MVLRPPENWKLGLQHGRPWLVASLLFIGPVVACGDLPEITTQPQSRTNAAGTVASFSVAAVGTEPLDYRWRRNDFGLANTGRIRGSTSNTLAIAGVRPADTGDYALVVSNAFGSVTSVVATLTVIVPDEVIVPDKSLEASIRSTINNPSDPLSPSDLAGLTSLTACNQDIVNLTGLEWATNLVSLSLSHNSITDLAPLEGLDSLIQLSVDDNHITDLSPLAGLSRITSLNVGDNLITNVADLSGLTNLSSLWLYGNSPDSLTTLTNLNGLTCLVLYNCRIEDITPLAGLINLDYLELRWNPLTNADTVLAGLTNLTTLYLGGVAISNLNFLQALAHLDFLNLDHNNISDLSVVATLPDLRSLDMGYNPLPDVSQVSPFTNLTALLLSGDSISDLASIQTLGQLTCLTLCSNQVSDLAPLTALTNLEELGIGWNAVTNWEALAACTNLTSLWLDGNSVSNLNFVQGLTRLNALGLRHNRLGDLIELGGLTNLIAVHAEYNRLTDLAALENLPSLSGVQVAGNLLDLSDGSVTMSLIQNLQGRGVNVNYLPQNQPPSILVVSNWIIAADATSALRFSASDEATPSDKLLVTASSSNPDLIPSSNIFVETGINQLLGVTPSPSQTGTATVALTVADETGSTTNASVLVTVVAPQPVVMPDPALEDAVRQASPDSTGDLTSLDLLRLNSLIVPGGDVTDLSGLEWASNLTELYLTGDSIGNLAALQGMTGLNALYLSADSIDDYSALSSLTNLTTLVLWSHSITNLDFLQNMVHLTDLTLNDTAVADWSSLAGLTNLTALHLADSPVTNCAFVQSLSRLNYVTLENCLLTDISPLTALTNLTDLSLGQNRLVDIGALTNLPGLLFVDLRLNLLDANTDFALAQLLDQGVVALYDPQREPPVFDIPDEWVIAAKTTSFLHFAVFDNAPDNELLTVSIVSSTGNLVPDTNLIVTRATNGPPQAWNLTVIPPVDLTESSVVTLIATNEAGLSTTATVTLTPTVPEPLDEHVIEAANLTLQNGGHASWFGQPYVSHDGVSAAQSGSIQDNEESWLQTTISGPSTLTFWWKISSEPQYDWLELYIDDELQDQRISGEVDWEQVTVDIPPGLHTVRWSYVKDQDWADGLDAAWLDQISVIAPAAVTLEDLDQVYDGGQHSVSVTTVPPDLSVSLTYDGSDAAPTNVGSYAVIGTINDSNYTGSVTNTLTINKAILTATADDKSRAYGQTNPVFTISYRGFVGADDTNSLASLPAASTAATITSPVGGYTITLIGGEDGSYEFNLVNGTLTITNLPQPLIRSISTSNGVAVIEWSAMAGCTYRLESRAGLTTPWTNQQPDIEATNNTATAVDNSARDAQRLYRIMLVQ